jgi:pimeloyl-ACP methyl ester carboxylesterase
LPTIHVNGVTVYYHVVGDNGPWVVLIPGGRRGHVDFVSLAEKLAAYGCRVLLHDRRNTGASDIWFDDGKVEEETWADDLYALMRKLDAMPAFVGGSSSGARTAILFALKYPQAVRGLLLMRITGGAFAAALLPEIYYDQYIRAAELGGMTAVCATEHYVNLIKANPANREKLMAMDPSRFIAVLKRQRELFVAGSGLPVMGITDSELTSISVPTIIIPGNDKTHLSETSHLAQRSLQNGVLHELPISQQDVALIQFTEWATYEAEIAQVFASFINKQLDIKPEAPAPTR